MWESGGYFFLFSAIINANYNSNYNSGKSDKQGGKRDQLIKSYVLHNITSPQELKGEKRKFCSLLEKGSNRHRMVLFRRDLRGFFYYITFVEFCQLSKNVIFDWF